jgi:hypothetical protein
VVGGGGSRPGQAAYFLGGLFQPLGDRVALPGKDLQPAEVSQRGELAVAGGNDERPAAALVDVASMLEERGFGRIRGGWDRPGGYAELGKDGDDDIGARVGGAVAGHDMMDGAGGGAERGDTGADQGGSGPVEADRVLDVDQQDPVVCVHVVPPLGDLTQTGKWSMTWS